jgi:uncharacterized protein (DUF302 family)
VTWISGSHGYSPWRSPPWSTPLIAGTWPWPYGAAVARTTDALQSQRFGVLTSIDVQQTLKAKLDRDFRKYVLLGACNPPPADRALHAELEGGLLLPCNVVVYETGPTTSVVAAMAPLAALGIVGPNPALGEVAREADQRLRAAWPRSKGASRSTFGLTLGRLPSTDRRRDAGDLLGRRNIGTSYRLPGASGEGTAAIDRMAASSSVCNPLSPTCNQPATSLLIEEVDVPARSEHPTSRLGRPVSSVNDGEEQELLVGPCSILR